MKLLLLAAALAAAMPPVHPLSEWSSEELGRLDEDHAKTSIVLHHTASLVSDSAKRLTGDASWKAAIDHARKAQFLHKHIRGWKEVGYHFMIDWEGRVLEGRPLDALGAHVEGKNAGSIGIVLMGDLSRQRATKKQTEALKFLVDSLRERYSIPPHAVTGHYQNKRTICPGTYLVAPVDYVQVGERPQRARRR